jgi:DNA-binding response OmpR family regulator
VEPRSNKRVLLIDYDPRSIGQIRRLLRASGYEMHIANNGPKGIESFNELEPDLTLVQDLIPGQSGDDVCAALRSTRHGQRSSICMLVSGYRRGGYNSRNRDAFIGKPFTDEELLETVQKLIGRGSTEPQKRVRPAIPVEFNESELTARLDSVMLGLNDDPGKIDA